ncbi:MAG: hypothetical protein FJ096_21310 [Deltaproteobacteria bacterium]|nr:hypothetical protein [Deltaproteobacteria bacterium]
MARDGDLEASTPEGAPASATLEGSAGWASVRTRATSLRCVVSGGAAWLITVAPILPSTRTSAFAKASALVSLGACVAGTRLIATRAALARGLAVFGFVAFSALAWALVREVRGFTVVDPVRGLFGALAWSIFAASWSHPWSVPDGRLREAPGGEATGLAARRKPPRAALALGALGPIASLGFLVLSLEVDDPGRAAWARALANVAAIALTSSTANLAVAASRDDRSVVAERWPIDGRVVRSVLVVGLLVVAAFLVDALR